MNGFIADFDIIDTVCTKCCNKCCTESDRKRVRITNISQSVALKCDFFLNVINCTDNFCTIIIQNGFFSIIRNIYTNYDMKICLPYRCCGDHIVTIGVDISIDEGD